MDATEDKRRRAQAYLARLGGQDLRFTGISGSVSYEAQPDDDIDIFLIAQDHHLWRILGRALLLRRLHGDSGICLSLSVDAHYARELFRGPGDYLMAADSVHVVPFHGEDYYRALLDSSPFVRTHFPERCNGSTLPPESTGREHDSPIEYLVFFLLAPYLWARSMVENRRLTRSEGPGRGFRAVLSMHCYYLDTAKYHALRERYRASPPTPGSVART